jgi:hypothetical protein
MSDLRAAAQQALEALEGLSEPYYVLKAQDALRAALEQEEIDWSLLEATQSSLREHMAEIRRLRAALEQEGQMFMSGGTVVRLSSEQIAALKEKDRE